MDPEVQLVKSDVTVEEIVELCTECNVAPSTHAVMVDFRSAGMQHNVGCYCYRCAIAAVDRIRDGLPA